MNFPFRVREAPKHAQRLLLHPRREFAALNQVANVREGPPVGLWGRGAVRVPVLVVLLNKVGLDFFDSGATFDPEDGLELMRLRQFLGCFEIPIASLESEKLPPPAVTNRFQRDVPLRHGSSGLTVRVEEIQAKPRRHVHLKDTHFNAAGLGSGVIWSGYDQRAA